VLIDDEAIELFEVNMYDISLYLYGMC
jgi:hypothetical protein